MNITSLIKITTSAATIAASALFTSCIQPAPQQQTGVQNQPQPDINPYAVPGLDGQAQAPYQPLPGVPSDMPNIQTPEPTPNYGTTSQPAQPTIASTHDVVPGDSLWRISRKYGVTVEAIQQANGLTGTNIQAGQKLNIPAGN